MNGYDLDAVKRNIRVGSVISIAADGVTIVVTGEPQRNLYNTTTNCPAQNINNHKGQMNLQQIGWLINKKGAAIQ